MWIVGHKPDWVRNVEWLPTINGESTKYQNSTRNLLTACLHDEVADRFLFFNDDHYILRPIVAMPILHRGQLDEVIAEYQLRYPRPGTYLKGMVATRQLLDELGFDNPLSYELHVPLPVDKPLMVDALKQAIGRGIVALHKRTLYGNWAEIGGLETSDVKLRLYEKPLPEAEFFSTSDSSFRTVAKRLARLFPEPSPYESSD